MNVTLFSIISSLLRFTSNHEKIRTLFFCALNLLQENNQGEMEHLGVRFKGFGNLKIPQTNYYWPYTANKGGGGVILKNSRKGSC